MKLVNIISANATAVDGAFDLQILADLGDGEKEYPFTYAPGDPHGLGPQVAAWLAAHPDLPIGEYVPPPAPFTPLSRPAFLFMMNKIGVTEAYVEALIAALPDGTEQEADAKALAGIVFRNQQTFSRDNPLLATLAAATGLSSETVDAAWRAAEQIRW
jgi:hypothetical protein